MQWWTGETRGKKYKRNAFKQIGKLIQIAKRNE